MSSPEQPTILFVTGKLAEPALRRALTSLAPAVGFQPHIIVLPITVVALASTDWIARHLQSLPEVNFTKTILPGLCRGDLNVLETMLNCPVERGPKDLRDLPAHFGGKSVPPPDYGRYDIEILAEINHAADLGLDEILNLADRYRQDGAEIIDLGCDPGGTWKDVGTTVRALIDAGHRVSVDSFNPEEVRLATRAGAELVLSVNGTNREQAPDWGAEVVAIPDDPATLGGLDDTINHLTKHNVPFRIDPILEPIGFGFAASLGRYLEVRRRYPDAEMMMGIGNLTELTEVDSAGVNMMLLGFCQELGIRSVLTTQVINWCRSCVREIDLARRLLFHAIRERTLPKHVESRVVMLRDSRLHVHGEEELARMAEEITDRNYRIFAEEGLIHVMNSLGHLCGDDPFALFVEMEEQADLTPSHAFYLGYEMAKAVTALTLGKNYTQDQTLRWGFLTRPESSEIEESDSDRIAD